MRCSQYFSCVENLYISNKLNYFFLECAKHRCLESRTTLIAILTVTSPIVINVPTRALLAVETKNSFVLWLANLNIKKLFINSEYRYIWQFFTCSLLLFFVSSLLSLAEYCSVMLSLRKASKQNKKRTTQKQAVIHFLPVRSVHMLWSGHQCRFEVNQIIRELKQSRQRRQQEPHKFAYLTMKNSIFARFARAFFNFAFLQSFFNYSKSLRLQNVFYLS